MIEKTINILSNFGYRVDYSPYHTDSDIKKYSSFPDHVSGEKFFTIYTPDGYVVGRIHELKENGKFKNSHLETIIGFFKMFEIPYRYHIIEELEKLQNPVNKKSSSKN